MAVFRVAKTNDYTVMSNHHLRNKALTLKAKGLLTMMLSLPDEWNYTTRGLAAICKEGVDSIGAALKELEKEGYIVRNRIRDTKGRITDTEYVIYEQPQKKPDADKQDTACPYTENPDMDDPDTVQPCTEKPAQLITNQSSTYKSNTQGSNPNQSNALREDGWDEMDVGTINRTRFEVMEQIDYDAIVQPHNREMLDEIVELMTEVLCSTKARITVSGNDFPAEYVKDRLRKLDCNHIEFIFESLRKKRTDVHNIKQYMLTTLFNATGMINSYYDAVARRDRLI